MKITTTLTIVAAAVVSFACSTSPAMFRSFSSPYSFDETVKRVSDTAKEAGWKVPAVGRIDINLAKAGKTIRPVAIVNLCNPDHAERLLKEDSGRVASAIMPCRVSVYETSNGVGLAMLDPDFLAAHLSGLIGQVIAQAARENAAIIQQAIAETD